MNAPAPRRPLGLLDVTCLGINAIVGSSIFLFPGKLAGMLGPASILAFGLTGVLLISVGLCFAEAASRFDRAGGPYLYAREAFGGWVGFGIGWMCWVTQIVSWAAVANGIAVYLGHFGLAGPSLVKGVAAAVILTMGALNYRGVKLGAWTSNAFTAAKLLPLAVFILAGLPRVSAGNYAPLAPQGWAPMGAACFLAYFAFQGFESIPVPSGEVDRPQRNVPLAVVGAMVFATLLYMLIQAVAVGVHPGLSASERPLADAAGLVLGPWGAGLIVLGAVFSTTGYNAGTALVSPRYLVALAEDGHIPEWFAARHERFGTPHGAVLATTGAAFALAMALDFGKLVDFSNIVVCAQYVATCAAVPLLRRRGRPEGALRLPGGPLLPLAGIAATLWLGAQGSVQEVRWSAAALALGVLLKLAFSRRGAAAAAVAAGALLLAPGARAAEDLGEVLGKRLSAWQMRRFLREVSKEPRVAGTDASRRAAAWIRERFEAHGLETETAEYDVLLSYPESAELELVKPSSANLLAFEGALLAQGDPLAEIDRLPWNAYSPSGEVEAQVVYANYGRPEDFRELDRRGISLKGRVVLTRYGKGYRGGKALEAQNRGAAAILFYSDPAEDGYAQGDPLPAGPWGPPDHFQRGGIVYDFLVPGDPLTPGWASTKDTPRIRPEHAAVMPRILSLPISYESARPVLAALGGPVAPAGWRGALPLSYHLGPGPARVRLKVKNRLETRPIVNVFGRIAGSEEPEKLVILSSHHDAWTRGAMDDGIGVSAMLELSRVLGELAKKGLRPRRTVVFAVWDAEEYTLTGSTEWGEQNAQRLKSDAVAVLNLDAYRWGTDFAALAVPSLRGLVADAAARVPDPGAERSLLASWKASAAARGEKAEAGILGSGSDYTVFLNHLGVPAVETTFTGVSGVYHSAYDDADWVERVDPGLRYVSAMARLIGLMAMRLADADVLPFDYSEYARAVKGYLDELGPLPALAPAREAAADWEAAAQRLSRELSRRRPTGAQARCLNAALMRVERELLDDDGLPGRSWFKHLVYAPRPSYEAITLPGPREALEAGKPERAAEQAAVLAAALRRAERVQARAVDCLY